MLKQVREANETECNSNTRGHYIRTHNGRDSQMTMLREVQHGLAGMNLVKSTRCRDGSVNDAYACGCIINRPADPSSEGTRRGPTQRTTRTTTSKRSSRKWLSEILNGMEE